MGCSSETSSDQPLPVVVAGDDLYVCAVFQAYVKLVSKRGRALRPCAFYPLPVGMCVSWHALALVTERVWFSGVRIDVALTIANRDANYEATFMAPEWQDTLVAREDLREGKTRTCSRAMGRE